MRPPTPTILVLFAFLSISIIDCEPSTHILPRIISSDMQLSRDSSPYVAPPGLVVQTGTTMIVEAGVTIVFFPGEGIDVKGRLITRGTEDQPIVFQPFLKPADDTDDDARNNWGSVYFSGDSGSGSSLTHTRLHRGAGRGASHAMVVVVRNTAPVLRHVTVTGSARDGIVLMDLTTADQLEEWSHVTVSHCAGVGVTIVSYDDQIKLDQLHVHDNKGSGIVLTSVQYVSRHPTDFCKLKCEPCELPDYPQQFAFRKDHREYWMTHWMTQCKHTFVTDADKVFAFHVLSATNNLVVKIRDGAGDDAPYLWNDKLDSDQWANPLPVLVTNFNTIQIIIEAHLSHHQRDSELLQFRLLSRPRDSIGVRLSNIRVDNHVHEGIALRSFQMPLYFNQIAARHNRHGVAIRECSSSITASGVVLENNRGSGMILEDTDGAFLMEDSVLSGNQHGLQLAAYNHLCHPEDDAVREHRGRLATDMWVMGSRFSHNLGNGVNAEFTCRFKLSVESCSFDFNHDAIHINAHLSHSTANNIFTMNSNRISHNSAGLILISTGNLAASIMRNTFTKNRGGPVISITSSSDYSVFRHLDWVISDNDIESNDMVYSKKHICVVCLTAERNEVHGVMERFQINRNRIVHNIVADTEVPSGVYTLEHLSAVVYLNLYEDVDFQHNILENAHGNISLAAVALNTGKSVDARYCFWGSTDLNTIVNGIIGKLMNYQLSKIRYHPYLRSKGKSHYEDTSRHLPVFVRRNEIGGILKNHVTISNSNDSGPYHVTKDVYIAPHGKLSIEEGVRMEFAPGTGIYVDTHGTLDIRGSSLLPVMLTSLPFMDDRPDVRLLLSGKPHEGAVQVKRDGRWWAVCYGWGFDPRTRHTLCQAAGFKASSGHFSVHDIALSAQTIDKIACPDGRWSRCVLRPENGDSGATCPHGTVLGLACLPHYWGGIHLSVGARPSRIRHVHLEYTGYAGAFIKSSRAAVRIDMHRHQVEHVQISNISSEVMTAVTLVEPENDAIAQSFKNRRTSRSTSVVDIPANLTDVRLIGQRVANIAREGPVGNVSRSFPVFGEFPISDEGVHLRTVNLQKMQRGYENDERNAYENSAAEYIVNSIGILVKAVDLSVTPPLRNINMIGIQGHGIVTTHSHITIENSQISSLKSEVHLKTEHTNQYTGLYVSKYDFPQRTTDVNLAKKMCYKRMVHLKKNKVLHLNINDLDLEVNGKCKMFFQAPDGFTPAFQYVSGSRSSHPSNSKDCAEKSLLFHHDPAEVQVEPTGYDHGVDTGLAGTFYWTSATATATLELRRPRSNQHPCVDIVLQVSAAAQEHGPYPGALLQNTEFSHFSHGVKISRDFDSVDVFHCTFTDNLITGLTIVASSRGDYNIQVVGSKFIANGAGCHAELNVPININIKNCGFEKNTALGLSVKNYYDCGADKGTVVEVESCNFHDNAVAAYYATADGFTPCSGLEAIDASGLRMISNQFEGNDVCLEMVLHSNNPIGTDDLIFEKNRLAYNKMGVMIGHFSPDRILVWKLIDNDFEHGTNTVLDLQGGTAGTLLRNEFYNNSGDGGDLIKLRVTDWANVEDNIFQGNRNMANLMRLFLRTRFATVQSNEIHNNSVSHAVMFVESVRHEGFNMDEVLFDIAENAIVQNYNDDVCSEAAAIHLTGFCRVIAVKLNVLLNPELTYELKNAYTTTEQMDTVNAVRNFWGNLNVSEIYFRIHSSVNSGRVAFLPTLPDSSGIGLSNETTDYATMTPEEALEHGYVNEDLTLVGGQQYTLHQGLVIPSGVTMTVPEGVKLVLPPNTGIYVYGTLHLQGSTTAPVKIERGPLAMAEGPCHVNVKLIGIESHEGHVVVWQGKDWLHVCPDHWTWENSLVICRALGYESLNKFSSVPIDSDSSDTKFLRNVYQCHGDERNLGKCPSYETVDTCTQSSVQLVACSGENKGVLHFYSGSKEKLSTLDNVIIDNVGIVQVSGKPPTFSHVTISRSDSGLVFVGGGEAECSNVHLSHVTVKQSGQHGISLFDITSRVLMENCVVSDVAGTGIIVSPSFAKGYVLVPSIGLLSTFRFCDASLEHYLAPGAEHRLFGAGVGSDPGMPGAGTLFCQRVIRTEPGHAVRLYIMLTNQYSHAPGRRLAVFYEGHGHQRQELGRWKSATHQAYVVQTRHHVMSVALEVLHEKYIQMAIVQSFPEKQVEPVPFKCNFEAEGSADPLCGWHTAPPTQGPRHHRHHQPPPSEGGEWTRHDVSLGDREQYGGLLDQDATFHTALNGHYLYAGSPSKCKRMSDAEPSQTHTRIDTTDTISSANGRAHEYQQALLESPLLKRDYNICSISFQFFHTLADYHTVRPLSLYLNMNGTHRLLWHQRREPSYRGWTGVDVRLPAAEGLADTYRLAFHATYHLTCHNAVGLDDVVLHKCPNEKEDSHLTVVNTKIENTTRGAISFFNNDPLQHSFIQLKRVSITGSMHENSDPAISLYLKSASVSIVNTYIAYVRARALHIEHRSETVTRTSKVQILQSVFEHCQSGISFNNYGVRDAVLYFTKNTIHHCNGTSPIAEIFNATVVADGNTFYNNSAQSVVNIVGKESDHLEQSQAKKVDNVERPSQQFTNTVFWDNYPASVASSDPQVTPHQQQSCTVRVNNTQVAFHRNVFRNPAQDFAFCVLDREVFNQRRLSVNINCSENWWGGGSFYFADRELRDQEDIDRLVTAMYKPVLEEPPEYFSATDVCPINWERVDSWCYSLHGGALTFHQAGQVCERQGAQLMSVFTTDWMYVKRATQYRDLDDNLKFTRVWVNLFSVYRPTEHCATHRSNIMITEESIGVCVHAHCDHLFPFVCQRRAVSRCTNSCSRHGQCTGRGSACVCDDGWEGADCSSFHCRDVSDCGGHGECMGPNQCRCQPGWEGRACSSSVCPQYTSCVSCSRQRGCGWCDSTGTCEAGSDDGSEMSSCPAWFFRRCITLESSTACSANISKLMCDARYCDAGIGTYDRGICQQCRDAQTCFSQSKDCLDWDNRKCPGGAVIPDYTDPSRADNVVLVDNVRRVDPDEALIYTCPDHVQRRDGKAFYLFFVKHPFQVVTGTILASAQSGGILHRIEAQANLGQYQLLQMSPVGLQDIITYADFEQEVDLHPRNVDPTADLEPDLALLSDFLKDTPNMESLAHNWDGKQFYKCAGHAKYFSAGNKIMRFTQFLVASQGLADSVQVGDVVFSSSSSGFLETVSTVHNISMGGLLVSTRLMHCTEENMLHLALDLSTRSDLACGGGDGWPGLVYLSTRAQLPPAVGTTIIGRKTGPVLARVVSKQSFGGFIFLETDVITGYDSHPRITTLHSRGPLMNNSDRIMPYGKDSIHDFPNIHMTRGIQYDEESGIGFFYLAPIFGLHQAKLMLKLKVNWSPQQGQTYNFGALFSGKVAANIDMELSGSGNITKKDIQLILLKQRLSNFVINMAGLSLVGKVSFQMDGAWSLSIQQPRNSSFPERARVIRNSYIFNVEYKVALNTDGFSYPAKPEIKYRGTSDYLDVVFGHARTHARLSVTPTVTAQWPAMLTKLVHVRRRHPLMDVFTDNQFQIDSSSRTDGPNRVLTDDFATIQMSLTTRIDVSLTTETCSGICMDPEKPQYVKSIFGVSALTVGLNGFNQKLQTEIELVQMRHSDCSAMLQIVEPCCICDSLGEPGIYDVTTEMCLCPCFCVLPTDNFRAVKSLQDSAGNCMCEICPHNNYPRRVLADIKCPCLCADGTEREMREDGSCDCECDCPDATKGVISRRGDCDCPCTCKNCRESQIGPHGCKCPDDVCPVCEDGSEPEWINCRCECPPPQCGFPPACVAGRTGPNCDLADCPACQDCSENGVCTASSDACMSTCACSANWEGECCDRLQRASWGDPHLQTLDGVSFDYFGIGQYWDCRSEANDFGYQVRYYGYKQTSFTGAVAVKAGQSVVTVTTPHTATATTMPMLRIDGILHTITTSQRILLDKEDVFIDIQPTTQSAGNTVRAGVALISMQFYSGVSLTIDVNFSPKMKRQYLNILLRINKDFKMSTSGLCGYLDNDPRNDMMGPDGVVYNDTDAFVRSWQLPVMTRLSAGVRGSWSWTESNFHPDDIVDSYDDPPFTPSYTLSGFTLQHIQMATDTCKSLGLTGPLLDGCIYDIVITNDTSLAQQETLLMCPRQCSGKGRCVERRCQCVDGWSGADCSLGTCDDCYFGRCEAGFCHCQVGWEGSECSKKVDCTLAHNCSGPDHGTCEKTDKCLCADGFTGFDCSIPAVCWSNCSGHGVCVGMDSCRCHVGWNGTHCDQVSCEALHYCSQHGSCVAYDVCVCKTGWKGALCGQPDCTSVGGCSGRGECVGPDTCRCYDGYEGGDCSQPIQCPQLQNCNAHGLCVLSDTGPSCRCHWGFSGSTCNEPSCAAMVHCSGHGRCTEPGLCVCHAGWQGPDCAQPSCRKLNYCSGHGSCVSLDQCLCETGWSGADCGVADCSAMADCSSQGVCVSPNKCECFNGYQGVKCSEKLTKNSHAPVFNPSSYSATVLERSQVPRRLLTVSARDKDDGQNGEIHYIMESSAGKSININNHLVVDSISGDVTLVRAIPRESVSDGTVNIQIVAADRGAPSKSVVTSLQIHVIDTNDHCPEISEPAPGRIIYLQAPVTSNVSLLQVKATDKDLGENGRMTYRMGHERAGSFFDIDSESGAIWIDGRKDIPSGNLRFSVVVSDSGMTPCARVVFIHVVVIPPRIPGTRPVMSGDTCPAMCLHNVYTYMPSTSCMSP